MALDGFPRSFTTGAHGCTEVRVPQIYHFNQDMHTQVLQDFADTTDLTAVLLQSAIEKVLPGSSPKVVGQALGSWLREFHDWASMPAQKPLLEAGRA
ncbi:ph domain protein [Apiospora phragmitis]|uniref:Ph domain protein n=1 Tax=Apiospora phragmitis TaxID=2905665 RepID=A0ABR1TPH5_9PEZI